jgi:hypothetical protein
MLFVYWKESKGTIFGRENGVWKFALAAILKKTSLT